MLTAVSAVMRSAVRRTLARGSRGPAIPSAAFGSRSSLRALQPHPRRDEQQSEDEERRKRDEDDQAGVRVLEQPRQRRDHQRDEHHRRCCRDQRAEDRERMARERFASCHTASFTSGSACMRRARRCRRAGSLALVGHRRLPVGLVFVAISFGLVIQAWISSALSFLPTPSSGFALPPCRRWSGTRHFCARRPPVPPWRHPALPQPATAPADAERDGAAGRILVVMNVDPA